MRESFRRALRSPIVWAIAAINLAFWALSSVVGGFTLVTITNAVEFCVLLAVCMTYGRASMAAVVEGRVNSVDYVIIGIVCWGLSQAILRLYVTMARLFGDSASLRDDWLIAYMLTWSAVGGVLLLSAPNAVKGKVPAKNWVKVGISVGIGAGCALFLLWLSAEQLNLVEVPP